MIRRALVALSVLLLSAGCMVDPGGPPLPPAPPPADRPIEFLTVEVRAYHVLPDGTRGEEIIGLNIGVTTVGFAVDSSVLTYTDPNTGQTVPMEQEIPSTLAPLAHEVTLHEGVERVIVTISTVTYGNTELECLVHEGDEYGPVVDRGNARLPELTGPLRVATLTAVCTWPSVGDSGPR